MMLLSRKGLLIWILFGCCSWSFTPIVFPFASQPAYAQNPFQEIWRRFTDRPRRDERPETVGQGGANRDRCPYTEQELIALVPTSEDTGLPYLERTIAAYPTWYFYVPYQPQLGRQLEFVLLDSNENILYQETFPLKNTPGILSLSLPEDGFGLEINQTYRWVFSVVCNPNNRSGDATVNGWIERESLESLTTNPETIVNRDRYLFYAENLYWFDAIDELSNLQAGYPGDSEVEEAWNTLLESLGLHDLPDAVFPIEQ